MTWDTMIKAAAAMFAFSGWFKVYYDHMSSKPKITGRLLTSMNGQMEVNGKQYSSFVVYPYLVNARKNIVHILDYKMSIKLEDGWRVLTPTYGFHKVGKFNFDSSNGEIKIKDFSESLIYTKKDGVQQGIPLHGWLIFLGDENLYGKKVVSYKLICVDANLVEHVVTTKPNHLQSLPLVAQIANIEFPDGMLDPK
ncbi:hypothetical protein JFT33_03640 [Pseudomonas carnis]|uniref:hypothetical protein n=1 Tax=Pseudomonas carnis TaxID=2487355 RepID=UPI000FDB899B|nr:hypothetical protein [Pseudomonas carnis]MBJ2205682.1 hypothetical protein [Pseudomonas carnis]